jgi:hypothetical protein
MATDSPATQDMANFRIHPPSIRFPVNMKHLLCFHIFRFGRHESEIVNTRLLAAPQVLLFLFLHGPLGVGENFICH